MPISTFVASAAASYAQGSLQTALGGPTRAIVYAGNQVLPNQALDWGDYIFQWRMGGLLPDQFKKESKELGYDVELVNRLAYVTSFTGPGNTLALNNNWFDLETNPIQKQLFYGKRVPTSDEALTMLNRELVTTQLAEYWIAHNFDGEVALAKQYMDLRNQIPGPSDLIRFAVRDCFTPEIVQRFGYSQELPVDILPWMKRQGLGGETDVPIPPGSTTTIGADARTIAQWFDLFWWSHWELPSVGQGYEMLQRLYVDSRYGPSPFANAETFFSPDDLELLLKANDYPPFWRARLTAISYTTLGRVDIRRMFNLGVLREDNVNHDVFHAYRQLGYDDTNAERLTLFTKRDRLKNFTELAVRQVDQLYKNGGYNEQETRRALGMLFYTTDDIDAHVLILKVQIGNEKITAVTKLMRRAFVKGHFTRATVREEFDKINLDVEVGDRLLSLWQLEKQTKFKDITTGQIIDAVKRGILRIDDARFRLGNFGYTDDDINLMLSIAQQQVALIQAKQQQKAITDQRKALEKQQKAAAIAAEKKLKANEKAATELAKAREAMIKRQLAAYSDKNITAFYKVGYLSQDNVAEILYAKGWDDVAVEAFLDTLNTSKIEVSDGEEKSEQTGGETTGQV